MLSKLIHGHIDTMEELEGKAHADIDKIIDSIDIDDLMDNPDLLLDLVDKVKDRLVEEHIPAASKYGFELADKMQKMEEKGKDIPIDPSKDPEKNKDIVE